jgi:hypothetical protein
MRTIESLRKNGNAEDEKSRDHSAHGTPPRGTVYSC